MARLSGASAYTRRTEGQSQSVGPSEEMVFRAFNGDQEAKNKKDAARRKRLKEINKDTSFSKEFENDYFRRQHANASAEAFNAIQEAFIDGDQNAWAVGEQRFQQFERLTKSFEAQDAAIAKAAKKVIDNPTKYDINDPREVDGVTYNNGIHALNSGAFDDNIDELARLWEGFDFQVDENDPQAVARGLPKNRFTFNPQQVLNPESVLFDGLTDSNYTEMISEVYTDVPGTNDKRRTVQRGLNDNLINERVSQTLGVQPYMDYAIRQQYKAARDANTELTQREYMQNFDVKASGIEAADKYTAVMKRTKRFDNKDNIPAPPRPTSTDWQEDGNSIFNKYYRVSPMTRKLDLEDGQYQMEGVQIGWNNPGTSQKEVDINLPKGTVILDPAANGGKGQTKHISDKLTGEGVKIKGKVDGVYRSKQEGDDDSWYVAYSAPMNDQLEKTEGTLNTFYIPAKNKQELVRTANNLGMSNDDLQGIMDKFFPDGKSGSGGGTISANDVPLGAKIDSKNGKSYYNGQEITGL